MKTHRDVEVVSQWFSNDAGPGSIAMMELNESELHCVAGGFGFPKLPKIRRPKLPKITFAVEFSVSVGG